MIFFFRRFIFARTKRYENEVVSQIEFMAANNPAKWEKMGQNIDETANIRTFV